MTVNVGPDYTFSAASQVKCADCLQVVTPEWDGAEGQFRCPECYEPMPEFDGE